MTAIGTAALLAGTAVASAAPVSASGHHDGITIWRGKDAKCPSTPSRSAHPGAVLATRYTDQETGCVRLEHRVMTMNHVKDATAERERGGSHWVLAVTLTAQQRREFGRVSAAAVGRQLAFVDGDHLITAPTVQEPLRAGTLELAGLTKSEARHLARVLTDH